MSKHTLPPRRRLPTLRHASQAAVLALGLATANAHADNLLVNGDAETGTLAGWTSGGVSNPFVDNGTFDPGIAPFGLYDFAGGNGLQGSLSQTVTFGARPGAWQANLSFVEQGLNQGNPSDNGYVLLTFLDVDHAVLGEASSPVIDSHDGSWQAWSGSFLLPELTASIVYTMNFTRNVGSDLDTFFDDNVLTVTSGGPGPSPSPVPEPGPLAMLLAGAGLLATRAARATRKGRAQN